MKKERLKEIKDSINLQIDYGGKNVFVQEEIDLYNYAKDLEKIIEEIREYIENNKIKISIKRNSEYAIPIEEIENILNKTNKE